MPQEIDPYIFLERTEFFTSTASPTGFISSNLMSLTLLWYGKQAELQLSRVYDTWKASTTQYIPSTEHHFHLHRITYWAHSLGLDMQLSCSGMVNKLNCNSQGHIETSKASSTSLTLPQTTRLVRRAGRCTFTTADELCRLKMELEKKWELPNDIATLLLSLVETAPPATAIHEEAMAPAADVARAVVIVAGGGGRQISAVLRMCFTWKCWVVGALGFWVMRWCCGLRMDCCAVLYVWPKIGHSLRILKGGWMDGDERRMSSMDVPYAGIVFGRYTVIN